MTSIDKVLGDEAVSLIKLDVEGAEMKALMGAERVIKTYRPRLAISVYHKTKDIVEIPKYLLSLHDDYAFYLRQYQLSANETVLYAV